MKNLNKLVVFGHMVIFSMTMHAQVLESITNAHQNSVITLAS